MAEPQDNVQPPLKPLHQDAGLSRSKLRVMELWTTETITLSLLPGRKDSLKVRPDGTILDGHHRLKVLRDRGVDVNLLPREIISRAD